MLRIPTDRAPTHPGEMLREEFLAPLNITQRELARAIHVPYRQVVEVPAALPTPVRGGRALSGRNERPQCETPGLRPRFALHGAQRKRQEARPRDPTAGARARSSHTPRSSSLSPLRRAAPVAHLACRLDNAALKIPPTSGITGKWEWLPYTPRPS